MISPDDDLNGMREATDPTHDTLHLFQAPKLCKISGMEEHISVWNLKSTTMIVRYANETD
jgi:hypothetical protein